MNSIRVDQLAAPPVSQQPLEIVERKGLGHPDSICDGIMEHLSIVLARAYCERFGRVLHYNLDKGLLVAGSVDHRFGGGHLVEPMRLVVGDRATFAIDGVRAPVHEIVRAAAGDWLSEHLPRIKPEHNLALQIELRPSSPELGRIFRDRPGLLPANDTSALVGYAPLSPTERLVLELERHLNGPAFKVSFPDTGEDVKVMAIRQRGRLHLTVAMPLLETYTESEAAYFRRKTQIEDALRDWVQAHADPALATSAALNTLDQRGCGVDGVYLSMLGTSAEDADSGQVGRGNRVNGVISLRRPAPAEAAAGKNPVSHVGKIYNVLAHHAANRIYQQVGGLQEVYVWLCSRIGAPIDEPDVAEVQVILEPGFDLARTQSRIAELVEDELTHLPSFIQDLTDGRYPVY